MLDAKNYLGKMLAERYRLVRVIGHGASSLVFYAEDMMVRREDGTPFPVAVKLLDHDSGEYKMNSKSFRTEIQAVAGIPTSPHIVAIKDVSFYEDEHFVVMEYVNGKTLKEYLKQKEGPLPAKEIVSISLQLLQALRLAHGAGVVHRDIKPENILVERADIVGKRVGIPGGADMPFIKLTDFGIALLPDEDLFAMKDKGVGTIHYISPEQAGGGRADARSDIYSLGVLMHVMATGQVPFDAQSPTGIISKHQTEMPHHVRGQNTDIPMALDEIIFTAMQKNPAMRYRDAVAMEKALKEVLRALEGEGAGADGDGVFRGVGVSVDEIAPKPIVKTSKLPKATAPKTPKPPKEPKVAKAPKERKAIHISFAFLKKIDKKILAIGGGGVALLAILIVGAILIFGGPKTYDIKVPTLVGITYTENAVYPEGVVVHHEKVQYVYNDEVDAGKVISQVPAQGTVVKDVEQLEIVLTVSLGPEMVDFEIPVNYRSNYSKAADYVRRTYKNVIVDNTPIVASERIPDVPAGTVIGAYRVETSSDLELGGNQVYKTKSETIKLVVQPAEYETFTMREINIITAEDAKAYLRENCPDLTVVATLAASPTALGADKPLGTVIGIRLSDGTVISTFDSLNNVLTFKVEKGVKANVYLILAIGSGT